MATTPNPDIGDIIATTIERRSKKAADNITRRNGLLNKLSRKGNVMPFSGGTKLFEEIEYAQNSTVQWYSGYEQINVQPSQTLTAAEYPIRQAAVAVSISGLEQLQNAGPEQMIDLIESRVKNAENTLMALIAQAVYNDGTVPKAIGGLRQLIATTPTNTVGGIDSGTWQFWKNITYGAVTNGGAATTSANIRRYMDALYPQLLMGDNSSTDLIVADNTMWTYFNESLQPLQRFQDEDTAKAGFRNLVYMGNIPVMLDGGFQGYPNAPTNPGEGSPNGSDYVPLGGVPAGFMYFINTNFLKYRPHSKRNFVPLNPDRHSINQDAVVKLNAWAGQLTVTNRRAQGVLYPT